MTEFTKLIEELKESLGNKIIDETINELSEYEHLQGEELLRKMIIIIAKRVVARIDKHHKDLLAFFKKEAVDVMIEKDFKAESWAEAASYAGRKKQLIIKAVPMSVFDSSLQPSSPTLKPTTGTENVTVITQKSEKKTRKSNNHYRNKRGEESPCLK